jgi:two-component system, NarL family, response regulator NreC
MPLSILLADNHKILRECLALMLQHQGDFQVVGGAANGQEAIEQAERLQPDVIVVDMSMPGINGLGAIRQIKHARPEACIVVLSAYCEAGYVVNALREGAAAHVLKEQRAADLGKAIRIALTGKRHISPAIPESAVAAYRRELAESVPEPPRDPCRTLTARERQVLALSTEGLGNGEIGLRLGISARTVEAHRARLMLKLGLHSKLELAREAQRRRGG